MKCLLKYQWVKLPRSQMPVGKGVMGAWARLASRAAFRNGHPQQQQDYPPPQNCASTPGRTPPGSTGAVSGPIWRTPLFQQ